MTCEKRFRVFVSYSHEDSAYVEGIVKAIDKIARPMWDKDFRYGWGFHDQIKTYIAHAHIFLPVITEESSRRGWIHQEIGYAMAQNIPVLPLILLAPKSQPEPSQIESQEFPGQMLREIQAIRLNRGDGNWLGRLEEQLRIEVLEHFVNDFATPENATYECAEHPEDRARLMVRHADEVRKLGYYGNVRQAGALSSFHIPREVITHQVWKWRYGQAERGSYHRKVQREERIFLETHARQEGCRLIVNPDISFKAYGPVARILRLSQLVQFLLSMPDEKVEIVLDKGNSLERSVTFVGDWFCAEAITARIGQGYYHTIYTRHAPTVQTASSAKSVGEHIGFG